MYSLEFIKWYSGMSEEKILAAHKRWLRENGQDITQKEWKDLNKVLYPKNKNNNGK